MRAKRMPVSMGNSVDFGVQRVRMYGVDEMLGVGGVAGETQRSLAHVRTGYCTLFNCSTFNSTD